MNHDPSQQPNQVMEWVKMNVFSPKWNLNFNLWILFLDLFINVYNKQIKTTICKISVCLLLIYVLLWKNFFLSIVNWYFKSPWVWFLITQTAHNCLSFYNFFFFFSHMLELFPVWTMQ